MNKRMRKKKRRFYLVDFRTGRRIYETKTRYPISSITFYTKLSHRKYLLCERSKHPMSHDREICMRCGFTRVTILLKRMDRYYDKSSIVFKGE